MLTAKKKLGVAIQSSVDNCGSYYFSIFELSSLEGANVEQGCHLIGGLLFTLFGLTGSRSLLEEKATTPRLSLAASTHAQF